MDKRPPVTTRESSKKDTLVIRLSLDKRFTEPSHWNKARQNPGALARAWMKEAAPVCGQFLQDTWGWELVPGAGGQDSVIKGLVRVKQKDQLTHLLAASGKLIQNVRFFLDPLDWSQTPSTWGKKPHISWVERRSKEDDLAYMTRAAKLNVNCGLAKGWRQIGVRSLTEPAKTPEVPVRSWVLKSAPRYWTYDQVTSFLEASQFTSVELVSKKWEKFGTSWIFKGKRDGPGYLQLLYSGDQFDADNGKFLVAERLQPAAWKITQRTKLRDEKRISLRSGPVTAGFAAPEVIPNLSEPGTPTQGQVEDESTMDLSDRTKRNESGGVRESPAKKRAKAQPLPDGVTKVPNEGGGDCLFHSISHSIEFTDNQKHHHRQVRAAAVSHLKRHSDKYACFWDNKDPTGVDMEVSDRASAFQKYLGLVEKVGAWAGNLEIAALASTLDRPIYIIHETGQIYGFNQEGSQKDLWIWYSRAQGHYASLQVPPEIALTLRTKALIAKPQEGRQECRGGGKTPSLGGLTHKTASLGGKTKRSGLSLGGLTKKSHAVPNRDDRYEDGCAASLATRSTKTVASVLKANKDAKAAKAKARSRATSGGSLGGQTKANRVIKSGLKATGAKTASVASGSQLSAKAFGKVTSRIRLRTAKDDLDRVRPKPNIWGQKFLVGKREPKTSWTCNLCGVTLYLDPAMCPLYRRRANHIAQRHPNERSKVAPMREYNTPVEATNQLPVDQQDWWCPYCFKALPSLPKAVKELSIQHHYKTKHPHRKLKQGAVNRLRWKVARKNPDQMRSYKQTKKSLGDKLRARAANRRDMQVGGHKFVYVAVNWETWPRPKKYQYRKGDAMMTCVQCRICCTYLPKTRCLGLRTKAHPGAVQRWEKLEVCPENRIALCDSWGITLGQAHKWFSPSSSSSSRPVASKHSVKKQWKRSLVEEGIEPNPGPSSVRSRQVQCDQFCISSLNTQGANACWSVLDGFRKPKQLQVLCLQEVRMTSVEIEAFKRSAVRAGYHFYYLCGHLDRAGNPRGGVAIMVDKRLISKVACSELTANSQLLGIWVEHCLVFSFYSPPTQDSGDSDPYVELAESFVHAFVGLQVSSVTPWVAVGDSNEIPGKSSLEITLNNFGGRVIAQGTNTRWESDREIDWFVTNCPRDLDPPQCLNYHWSDHKMIQSGFRIPPRDFCIGRLQKTPVWDKPDFLSVDEWRAQLEDAWVLAAQSLPSNISDLPVQDAWDHYNAALNHMFLLALSRVKEALSDPGQQAAIDKATRRITPKGQLGKWTSHSLVQRGPLEGPGFFKFQKN